MASKPTGRNITGIGFFESEVQARATLMREGVKLEKIAKRVWSVYMNSYTPVEYVRTGNSAKSLLLGKPKYIGVDSFGNTEYGIELTWRNDLVYHDSWIYKKGKTSVNRKGHSVMLIGTKWHAPKLEKIYRAEDRGVYRHTRWEWEGANGTSHDTYIDAVMNEYSKISDRRMSLELQWSEEYVK